jgi:hypothetical protein
MLKNYFSQILSLIKPKKLSSSAVNFPFTTLIADVVRDSNAIRQLENKTISSQVSKHSCRFLTVVIVYNHRVVYLYLKGIQQTSNS